MIIFLRFVVLSDRLSSIIDHWSSIIIIASSFQEGYNYYGYSHNNTGILTIAAAAFSEAKHPRLSFTPSNLSSPRHFPRFVLHITPRMLDCRTHTFSFRKRFFIFGKFSQKPKISQNNNFHVFRKYSHIRSGPKQWSAKESRWNKNDLFRYRAGFSAAELSIISYLPTFWTAQWKSAHFFWVTFSYFPQIKKKHFRKIRDRTKCMVAPLGVAFLCPAGIWIPLFFLLRSENASGPKNSHVAKPIENVRNHHRLVFRGFPHHLVIRNIFWAFESSSGLKI